MSTGGLIPQTEAKEVIDLDQTIKSARVDIAKADEAGNTIQKALVLARYTRKIREMLSPMMGDIIPLAGSPLGFKTDRDRKSEKDRYSEEEILDVVTVALLKGFQLVGNEFNIIAGNFYGTKEGFERLVREFPGLRDLKLQVGAPVTSPDGKDAKVSYDASWNLNGKPDEIHCQLTRQGNDVLSDTRIVVRVNDFMGVDGILGKAKAKMLRRIYERLTGSLQSCVDDIEDGVDESRTVEGTGKLTEAVEQPAAAITDEHGAQTFIPDLDEVYRQYVDDVNNAETIDDSIAVRKKFFESNLYKWSDDHRSKSLRVLEKRQDAIREECGKRIAKEAASVAKAKGQKQLVN